MSNVYAWKDQSGNVVGISHHKMDDDQELVSIDAPEVVTYLRPDYIQDELERAKKKKLMECNDTFARRMEPFTGNYPIEEMLSWDLQSSEAANIKANPASSAPLLNKIAGRRGMDVEELALRVRKKEAAYKYAAGILIGIRQNCEDQISGATSVSEVDAVQFSVPSTFEADVQAEVDSTT